MDGCCSVLARQRLGEKKEGGGGRKKKRNTTRKKKTEQKNRKSEIRRRNDARLRSCFQPKMHGVPPECRAAAAAAAAAADVVVSLRAGPGRLAGEHTDTK